MFLGCRYQYPNERGNELENFNRTELYIFSVPERKKVNLSTSRGQFSHKPAGIMLAALCTCTQAMLLLRRPLNCQADRGLLIFSLVAAYVDLGSDVGAAVTFYLGKRGLYCCHLCYVVVVVVCGRRCHRHPF